MSQSSAHINSIIITPPMLKEQIIIRINTLVGKNGGSYFPMDEKDNAKPIAVIEGMEVHGIETKGRDVYLLGVPTDENIAINLEDEMEPYNANEFYLEHLWQVYLGCEPIYQSRFNDYASFQH